MHGLALVIGALGLVVLTGCGPMPLPTPTAAPSTASPSTIASGSPAARSTPATGMITLGDLVHSVNGAWPNVHTYRISFVGAARAATPSASPTTAGQATPVQGALSPSSMREAALSGIQRQTVSGYGTDDHEAILNDGRIYIRGPLVQQLAPGSAEDSWVAINASDVDPKSRLGFLLGGLPLPPPPPLAGVPQRLWPQTLRDLGHETFDGRDCHSYAAADTITTTGTRVDYVIAVDADGLPCFVQTSSGGIDQGRVEYTNLNGELTITSPGSATPVPVIPAALATPAAHD